MVKTVIANTDVKMEKRESGKKGKGEGRITVDITGEVFKQVIALRHEREMRKGTVVSVSEVVRDAVKEKYEREIGREEEGKEK